MDGFLTPVDSAGGAPGGVVDYRLLVAESADVVTVAGRDGVYCYLSPACRRLFGWDPARLVGQGADEFVHPDDLMSFHAGLAGLGADGFVTMTYRFLCRDGSYRWTETTLRASAPVSGVDMGTPRSSAG